MLIQNGTVFVNGAFRNTSILIENEGIAAIGNTLRSGEKPLNASGIIVLPGLIDPHVHLREPGAEHKEDFKTGTEAAVAGGFTTVIDMPNNPVPTTTVARLTEKRALASKKACCDVFFHFGATDGNFAEVREAAPLSLKIYMGRTIGELILKNQDSLQRHFLNFPKQKPIVLHAADDEENEKEGIEHTCRNIRSAIEKANEAGGRKLHLAHASTKKEARLTRACPDFTFEIAPHHLFLSAKDRERLGCMGTVYPPLRSEEQRRLLWELLPHAGCIATDHAPHTAEDKEAGARGFPGLETSLSLMLDAYNRKLLKLEWIVGRMSEGPAAIFGLAGMGKIEVGATANLTLIDVKKEWVVKGEELYTKCKWSPFEGKRLKGRVHSVLFKGKKIFEEGECLT